MTDQEWMCRALALAREAENLGEVPVGAVIVEGDDCIAEGWNQPINSCDPSAHAEIEVIRAAARHFKNYRLNTLTLYVTLEPCVMCAGAIIQARLKKIVFGAYDPRAGAAGSVFNILNSELTNHRPEILGGMMEAECATMLQTFFKQRR